MDYERIYNELIEHRKMQPKLEEVYYERHHIIPVCRGGGDEAENLIYLTAEDHFVAHLLLAKVYGGRLWVAANAMCMKGQNREIRSRYTFGIIRRRFVESITGENNWMFDHNIYRLIHTDTEDILEGNRAYLAKKINRNEANLSSLISGRYDTLGGYCLENRLSEIKRKDQTIYKFERLSSGEIVEGTYFDIADKFMVSRKHIKKLVQGKMNEAYGFIIAGSREKFKFIHTLTGRIFFATRKEFVQISKISSAHANLVFKGESLIAKGYALYDNYVSHIKNEIIYTLEKVETCELFITTRRIFIKAGHIDATNFNKISSGKQQTAKGYRILQRTNGTWH